jgi:hypothetical protein
VEYAKFVEYPVCFYFVELILEEEEDNAFVIALASRDYRDYVHQMLFNSWKNRGKSVHGEYKLPP